MALIPQVVEVLEALWILEERGQFTRADLRRESGDALSDELLESMLRDELMEAQGPERIRLTPEGRRQAEKIIRRHRLAERLICDVLGARVDDSEAAACEFEHILAEGITSSICTLLGHPHLCPHNRPIPPGECCFQDRGELKPIVVPCTQMSVGEISRVAYFCTTEHSRLLKLSSLGLRPGNQVKLLQKWPSYVIQVEETEIALEEDVARNIYVRQDLPD